jgi:hypothetical protein
MTKQSDHAAPERIPAHELAYYAQLERAATEAALRAQPAIHAVQSYRAHLMACYALSAADEIDLETGAIRRGVHAAPPIAPVADAPPA